MLFLCDECKYVDKCEPHKENPEIKGCCEAGGLDKDFKVVEEKLGFSMDLLEVKDLLKERSEYYENHRVVGGNTNIPFDIRDYMALMIALDVIDEEIKRR